MIDSPKAIKKNNPPAWYKVMLVKGATKIIRGKARTIPIR
jgi:hypothetical protein